jgi:integrase
MCRDYYLHTRNGIYYVEYINKVSGKKLSARSTGETDEIKAQVKAELWLANGIPTGRKQKPRPIEEAAGIESIIKVIRKSELNSDDAMRIVSTLKSMALIDISAVKNTGRGATPFVQFLETFWNFDKSEYIQDQLTHGYRFTRGHAQTCQRLLKAHIRDFFGDKKLNSVTTDDLNKLSKQLAAKGLSTSSRNQILLVACKPLKWAFGKKIIPENPCFGLTKFSITNEERGVLTEAETKAVFSTEWKDKRAFVASLVAATTGARQGECLALRLSDIGEDTLYLRHNFSRHDGLKCPKNGHKRIVPLLPVVKAALLDLLNDNPYIDKENQDSAYDPFIFYSLLKDKPCDYKVLLKGFKEAMDSVNVMYLESAKKQGKDKPEIAIDYKGRNIVFHSWRHWFCTVADNEADMKKVKKVSGHLTDSMYKRYSSHTDEKDVKEVGKVLERAFENIVSFRKAG